MKSKILIGAALCVVLGCSHTAADDSSSKLFGEKYGKVGGTTFYLFLIRDCEYVSAIAHSSPDRPTLVHAADCRNPKHWENK